MTSTNTHRAPFGPRADRGYATERAARTAAARLNVSDVEGATLEVEGRDGRFYVILVTVTA